ncbi:Protein ABCI12 [Cardamine amara subsp. amara]|uniref:Protein ABCI12 n=1 Tax=Cardamine amara subsp. amara TaxID=228776 RepID=A0ABD0ZS68_CARAN
MNHSNPATPTLSLTVTLIPKHLIRPILDRNFANPKLFFPLRLDENPACLAAKRAFQVRAKVDGDEKTGNWVNRLPILGLIGAENVFRLISSATGSPIGEFI